MDDPGRIKKAVLEFYHEQLKEPCTNKPEFISPRFRKLNED